MKVIIRDDDTCALTRVEQLEQSYKQILGQIPICLSVTPFRIPGAYFDVKSSLRNKQMPLENNPELVSFLKESIGNGDLDIAMHGYTHIYYENGVPEYNNNNDSGLKEKTSNGRAYLENLLGCTINTFVPPSNMISKAGIEALEDNKMNLVGSPSLWKMEGRPFNTMNFYYAAKRFLWKRKTGQRRYPFVIDLQSHKEIEYFVLYPGTDISKLKEDIDFCHSVDGVFVLSMHYHEFKEKVKSGETIEHALYDVINYMSKEDNPEYIKYSELW